MNKLSDFKAGQRVRLDDGSYKEGVVTFVHEQRAPRPDEVNVIWDTATTPMPCAIEKLIIIFGAKVTDKPEGQL